MSLEGSRRCELTQFMADHVFRDVHGNEFLPVMHGDSVPHHLGRDSRSARPCLMNLLFVFRVHREDRFVQMIVDERPLF